jgi:hypothetical protein
VLHSISGAEGVVVPSHLGRGLALLTHVIIVRQNTVQLMTASISM